MAFLTKRKSTGRYYIKWTSGDKDLWVSTGCKSKADAMNFFLKWKYNKHIIPKNITLEYLFDDFLSYSKVNHSPGTYLIYSNFCRLFKDFIGNKQIIHLSLKDAENYKSYRYKSVAVPTINIEVRSLKSIFNYAVNHYYIDSNPFAKLKQFSVVQKKLLVFSDEQVNLILNSVKDDNLKKIILFALNTGCRISEILNLKFKDVDFYNRKISICNDSNFKTKTGKIRIIPINNVLFDLFNSNILSFNQEECFFNNDGRGYKKNYISKKFKKLIRKLRFPEDFHFHCFRHTFASKLISNGVDINTVKELLGHSNINTTLVYLHSSFNQKLNAVNKIGVFK
ncbi:MAG: hypothetical protein FJ216_11735 [Ignavibacteria bacterium]|nr:hypothetical protein [Ignavibacteria bacterium]